MRLLFVVNEAYFFISHRLPIALEAKAHGFEVHVATPRSKETEQISRVGLMFHAIPLSRSGLNPLRDLGTLISLMRLSEWRKMGKMRKGSVCLVAAT